jgi:hypothetical protein
MTATAAAKRAKQQDHQLYCSLDDWYFDPRYTDGKCPICGWAPDNAVLPMPPWEATLRRLPWDYIFLGVLFVGLVVMGIIVGIQAHLSLLPNGY